GTGFGQHGRQGPLREPRLEGAAPADRQWRTRRISGSPPGGKNMPRAKVNGAEMYYEEAGSGSPLILSPGGLQGVLSSYQPVSTKLSQAHRVITYDRCFDGQP